MRLLWILIIFMIGSIGSALIINPPTMGVEPPIKEVKPKRDYPLSRPQACAHLLRDHDPNTWDPVTETYPRNIEWEKCMGVH